MCANAAVIETFAFQQYRVIFLIVDAVATTIQGGGGSGGNFIVLGMHTLYIYYAYYIYTVSAVAVGRCTHTP